MKQPKLAKPKGVCRSCGVAVEDLTKHMKRNRCQAQHIRHEKGYTEPRGLRRYHFTKEQKEKWEEEREARSERLTEHAKSRRK